MNKHNRKGETGASVGPASGGNSAESALLERNRVCGPGGNDVFYMADRGGDSEAGRGRNRSEGIFPLFGLGFSESGASGGAGAGGSYPGGRLGGHRSMQGAGKSGSGAAAVGSAEGLRRPLHKNPEPLDLGDRKNSRVSQGPCPRPWEVFRPWEAEATVPF